MQDGIWARSTIEQLLSRQCQHSASGKGQTGAAAQARRQRGQFRPGLRVIAIDAEGSAGHVDRWLDHPTCAVIEG